MKEKLKALCERVLNLKDRINTEEATKNAFIMPFLQILGYDVFNPLEVIPEYIADTGVKKGEKVDYCIQKDDVPIFIIECKHWQEELELHNTQLERYFGVTNVKFGVLTNGIKYRFYSDLDEQNIMDKKPFLIFDIENLKENEIKELEKFHKQNFDINKIIDSASELRYFNDIKKNFDKQLTAPTDEFVKLFAREVYNGKLTEKILEQFSGIVKKAINIKITETINSRLNKALNTETVKQIDEEIEPLSSNETIIFSDEDKGIYTTQEEIDGFNIVLEILGDIVETERIVYRDTKHYLGILLDDSNRQPICRLWFNRNQKYLGIFDADKNEEKIAIDKIEHIYIHAQAIKDGVSNYLSDDKIAIVE